MTASDALRGMGDMLRRHYGPPETRPLSPEELAECGPFHQFKDGQLTAQRRMTTLKAALADMARNREELVAALASLADVKGPIWAEGVLSDAARMIERGRK